MKNGQDKNEVDINTWEVQLVTFRNETDGKLFKEQALVHDTEAWKNVGYIRILLDISDNSMVFAKFFYWSSFPMDKRDGSHGLYLYGRLSELLLVHFMNDIRAIYIAK